MRARLTLFSRVSDRVSHACSSPWPVLCTSVVIFGWLGYGLCLGYGDWSLGMDLLLGLPPLWLAFLLVNGQNRTSKATLAQNERILDAIPEADSSAKRLDECEEDEIDRLR